MPLRSAHIEESLTIVGSRLGPILGPEASTVLEIAKSTLRRTSHEHAERIRQGRKERPLLPWGFTISPDYPLRFKETVVGDLKLRVDLFSRAYWDAEPAERPIELTVAIRVWCLSPQVYFRSGWDAPKVKNKVDPRNGRVMLRLHFDLANKGQPGPQYHLQVGGKQHPGELHWFPESVSVPRMLHMPVDLVLASEMVAATFYPDEYRIIRREPSWIRSLRIAQGHLLHEYLARAMYAVENESSVLESLWNVAWD